MANTKLLPGNWSIYAAFPEADTDWSTLSAATMTAGIAAGLIYDISCAVSADNATLNATDSETSDSRSICDTGNGLTPSFVNYEASLDGFRSDPTNVTAVYNTFYNLFNAPDRPYYLIKRIGPAQGAPWAAGQLASVYGVNTDYPTDIVGDNEEIRLGARFKPTGIIFPEITVAA